MRKVDQFNRMLLDGKDADVAVREAFGEMAPYLEETRSYVKRSLFSYVRIPVSLETRSEAYRSRPLSAAEAAVLRGEFLVAMNRPAEARALAAEAAKADPSLPGPWEIEAGLLDSEKQRDEARAAFAKAATAGSKRAHVYYRLAQLEWKQDADEALLKRLSDTLEKARSLEPDDANTLSFLAEVRTDQRQPEEAVSLARRAVEIEPAESYHRLALARALWSQRRPDEAMKVAQTALQAAATDSARQNAQAFLDFASRESEPLAVPVLSDAAPTSNASGTPAVPVPDKVKGGSNNPLVACFEKRDDHACGRAVPALQSACQAGQPMACRSLGSLYDGGFGVAVDKSRAAAAYERGCGQADKGSCARYAVLQFHGQGVARDPGQALPTLQRLCGDKVDDACIGWALVLAARPGKAELARARQLLQDTCDRGNEEACRMVTSMPR